MAPSENEFDTSDLRYNYFYVSKNTEFIIIIFKMRTETFCVTN